MTTATTRIRSPRRTRRRRPRPWKPPPSRPKRSSRRHHRCRRRQRPAGPPPRTPRPWRDCGPASDDADPVPRSTTMRTRRPSPLLLPRQTARRGGRRPWLRRPSTSPGWGDGAACPGDRRPRPRRVPAADPRRRRDRESWARSGNGAPPRRRRGGNAAPCWARGVRDCCGESDCDAAGGAGGKRRGRAGRTRRGGRRYGRRLPPLRRPSPLRARPPRPGSIPSREPPRP
mmetsp:Transcript_24139/g.58323  ORF Transcript_24139/g.58323 Transcript_24139/m.58323 type:complete len:229 (-) Transcript_24139:39-725(-)